MAISTDGVSWFLINASPDLGAQIDAFPALHPQGAASRHSPIEAVLLTNADLDHVLGLLLLREGDALLIHATAAVHETLNRGLHLEKLLGSFCGLTWQEPPLENFAPLFLRTGKPSGLAYRGIVLAHTPPLYFRENSGHGAQSIAYEIKEELTGKKLVIAPDVETITPALFDALREADAVLFDGTFWSDGELQQIRSGARTAREMGHLPIQPGSLPVLRELAARPKVLVHINNTNPIFRPGSTERAEVEAAGMTVGYDGLEFVL